LRVSEKFNGKVANQLLLAYIASMNNRQRKTLEAVFAEPTKTNIAWPDIESLLISVGCNVIEGTGSRVRFTFEKKGLAVHRPHPQKEAKQYVVRAVRDFLRVIGAAP
jgi:HicA toxin of bacterial toxin-antitoxin,